MAIFVASFSSNAAPVSEPQEAVNVVRTTNESVAPLTQVRVVPVNTQQFSHLAHSPAHTLLRTVPATHAVHSLGALPAVIRSDATHLVHTAPAHTVQAVRTVPAHTVVHSVPTPVRTTVVAEPAEAAGVAQYSFGYSIADTKTGDSKTRQETRNGDVTTGSYSVADPDGRIRTVTYTADAIHGFQAHVTYDGEEGPPAIAINAPETAEIVSNASPTVIEVVREDTAQARPKPLDTAEKAVADPEPVAVSQSTSLFDNRFAVSSPVHTLGSLPTLVRTDGGHILHNSQFGNIHAVRTVPAVVRSDATHLVHTAPTHTVHHALPQHIRAVSSPTAGHVVHHSDHSTPTATILRSVSPNVLQFQTAAGIRSVPVIGLGSNQFLRAVHTVPSSATHLVHA